MKAPSNHWDHPLGELLSSKSCVKKPSAVAGMLALLTYVTIIGTRYPELDTVISRMTSFSLATTSKREQCTRGGFYPSSGMRHTATSMPAQTLGKLWTGSRALLWLPKMVILRSSTTGTRWLMPLPPRSVTSCAGMTAYLVLLAQTRVGFLCGGRGKSFYQLPPQEQAAQREEAYANLLHHGPTGHAWVGRGSDYHGLLEIWCLLQWA